MEEFKFNQGKQMPKQPEAQQGDQASDAEVQQVQSAPQEDSIYRKMLTALGGNGIASPNSDKEAGDRRHDEQSERL